MDNLNLAERLILNEIGDFTAGLGHPGEPETPEQIHAELIARVQRVFADVKAQFTPVIMGVDWAAGTDKSVEIRLAHQALQQYHTHFVKQLIDCRIVTDHGQIISLQNQLNAYLTQHHGGAQ